MGQAAIDLPDPLKQTPAPLANADDLLSQLAGQEIDRLLAESEDKDGAPAGAGAEAGDSHIPTDAEIEALLTPAGSDTRDRPTSRDKPTSRDTSQTASEDAYSAELDEVFRQIEAAVPGESSVIEPETTAADAKGESASAEHVKPQVAAAAQASTEEATSAAEFSALNLPDDSSAESANPPADESAPQMSTQRDSLPVRLLEVMNAPFSFCPDAARDMLGKIAILTLLNAIGVLIYLLLFRK